MTWKEYYDRYDGWQESSQYSRLASVTDFGPDTSPADEIVECVQCIDEKTARSVLLRAVKAGVLFDGEQLEELIGCDVLKDNNEISVLLNAHTGTFTADNLIEILCCVPDPTGVEDMIDKMCSKPTHFKDNEAVALFQEISDERIANKMLMSIDTVFSEDAINELCDLCVDEKVIKKLCEQSGIPYADPDDPEQFQF